jgi:chaperone BCS1
MIGNQLTVSLVATTIIAGILAYCRNIPGKVKDWFWRHSGVTGDVKNTDQAFNWISLWLDLQPYSKRSRHITISTYNRDDADDGPCEIGAAVGAAKKRRPRLIFTPSIGQHVFFYKKRLIWLSRMSGDTPGKGTGGDGRFQRETFSIWAFGRSQKVIRQIIQDAMEMALPSDGEETLVISSTGSYWQRPTQRRIRPQESVILPDGMLDSLVADAKEFIESKRWYHNLGIPYRRGYLFHGVPGSGKTSTVVAIAGTLGLDVYMLNLGDRMIGDSDLSSLMGQVPTGAVVLLEDIDAIFTSRDINHEGETKDKTSITFSGILNAIDGVAATEGRLLFMTTNHKAKLDPALIRPGRADVDLEFGYADKIQAARIFQRFYPSIDHHWSKEFAECMREQTSMADIQGHLLKHKKDWQTALDTWKDLNKETESSIRAAMNGIHNGISKLVSEISLGSTNREQAAACDR